MKNISPKELGKFGEQLAKEFLISQGHQIIASSYHSRFGEVDIISNHQNKMIFTEVKTRKSNIYGLAEESLTPKKITKLLKTIYKYLQEFPLQNKHWRLDAITIKLHKDFSLEKIQHYKNLS